MGHRKEMAKRKHRMKTSKQKHRYMDYEKMDLSNNDLRYLHPDIMGIIKGKKAKAEQKVYMKPVRRMRKS